jgi:hypothetical protein
LRTQPLPRVPGARSHSGIPAQPLPQHAQDLPIRRRRLVLSCVSQRNYV